MHNHIISIIVALSLLLISCKEDNSTEPEQTVFDVQGKNGFVGKVNDTDAFIALLIRENEGIVYACNGDEEIYEWFRGSIDESTKINLNNNDGAQVSAEFTNDSFEGEIILRNGNMHSFTATPSNQDSSGIYHLTGDTAIQNEIEGGWIVNSEGEERGAFIISGVFQNTPRKPKLGGILDGTSNTIFIGQFSLSLFHFTFP